MTRRDSHQEHHAANVALVGSSAAKSRLHKLREKSKLAAAKCRERQRKQLRSVEFKHDRICTMNGELKRQVRNLAGELNTLRALALQHQNCNCEVTCYNLDQAKKIAEDLRTFGMTEVNAQSMNQSANQAAARLNCSLQGYLFV